MQMGEDTQIGYRQFDCINENGRENFCHSIAISLFLFPFFTLGAQIETAGAMPADTSNSVGGNVLK
jgi:hypothetical protein